MAKDAEAGFGDTDLGEDLQQSGQRVFDEAAVFARNNFWLTSNGQDAKNPLTIIGGLSAMIPESREDLQTTAELHVATLKSMDEPGKATELLVKLLEAFIEYLKKPSAGTEEMQKLVRENRRAIESCLKS